MDETRDLTQGLRVGRYQLEREVGGGGIGVVWLASDPVLRRKVAIKVLHPDRHSEAEERFLRGARAMAKLSHPSVVAVFDIGTADQRVFFAMEYVEGTTLARHLEGQHAWRDVVGLFIAAGRGLAAAHAADVVHGDFKPANVLVGTDGSVKVVDFGLAGELAGLAADQLAFAVALQEALARTRDHEAVPAELSAVVSARHSSMQLMVAALQRVLAPDPRELKFGMPPTGELSVKRQHTADLAHVLADRFGLRLGVTFGADYRGLVDDLVSGRLDAAWLPPLGILRAGGQARPVLVLSRGGRGSYHGALCVRRDSGIAGIADLRGKRIGWVDEDSTSGYVLARALIAERHPDIDAFLGPQQILGSHRAVVEAVLDGSIDAGATFLNFGPDGAIIASGWHEFLDKRADEVVLIAVTQSIPGDAIAVRSSLPDEDAIALIAGLRDLASDPAQRPLLEAAFNHADALSEPRLSDYDALGELAGNAGWRR